MPFASLSDDLLWYITLYITRADCANLRLVCNVFADIFAHSVLHSFTITVRSTSEEIENPTLDLLKWMSGGSTLNRGRVEALRKLTIRSLSPANHLEDLEDRQASLPDEVVKHDQEVMSILRSALKAACNVRTLIWNPHMLDPESSHEIVAQETSQYNQLQHLDIDITYLTTPVLAGFSNLTFIKYGPAWVCNGVPPVQEVVESFAQAVIQSPKLTSLCVSTAEGSESQLDFVLKKCSDAGVMVPLKEFNLQRCLPYSTILPHIRQLSKLDITLTSTFGSTGEVRRELFDNLWLGLLSSGAHLQHIGVDRVPDALIEYLKSYEGLESFRFYNCDRESRDLIEKMYRTGERFFHEALTNHASTIAFLEIQLEYEDQWCFHRSYGPMLAQCKNLESLGIGLGYGQIGGMPTPTDPLEEEYPALHVLLNSTIIHCPSLKGFTIYNPLPNRATALDPYSGHMEYYQHKGMWEITDYKLRKWRPPTGSNVHLFPNIHLAGFNRRYVHVATEMSDGSIAYKGEKVM